jgi:L-erythrulose 1-phosphate isomerase
MARKIPWVGTSWKMHKTRSDALSFAQALKNSHVSRMVAVQPFVIPPFPYVADVADVLQGTVVKVGAQNMHWDDKGAWTGEVSAPMLVDCGATLVELGHSERRAFFNETDETVALKVQAALRNNLTALVCIGDTRSEYEAGATADVLARQARFALKYVGAQAVGRVVLAYEPVWSIGEGGIPADPDFANAQHATLKAVMKAVAGAELPILYGGSVNPQNCVALATRPHIDGLFIGRSAWDVQGYIGIVDAVSAALVN